MTTLAEHMIVAGVENRPPMLDKIMYNSWQSRMLLYIKGNKNGRMMVESIENGPLVYPTIVEDGLPPDVYSLLNHSPHHPQPYHPQPYQHAFQTKLNHTPPSLPQNAYHTPPISQQPQAEFPQLDSGLVVPSFLPRDDPIVFLNKAIEFLSTVVASQFPSTNNYLKTSSNPRNQATIQDDKVTVQQVQRRQGQSFSGHMARQCTQPKRTWNSAWFKEKMLLVQAQEFGQVLDEEQLAILADPGVADGQATQTTIPQNAFFQTDDLDAYDSDYDDISSVKVVLMANLSSYDSDVLSEVPQHDTYQNDNMVNQSVQESQYFEQSFIDYVLDNEITSDSNIISYEQYLYETQNAIV
ncbi:hypothetical protein Tco_0946767 [Tanacetum coccineum]